MALVSNPGVGAFPGSQPTGSGLLPPPNTPPVSSFGNSITPPTAATTPPPEATPAACIGPVLPGGFCVPNPLDPGIPKPSLPSASDIPGLSQIGDALGKIADAFKAIADFFGGIKDAVTTFWKVITSPTTWKAVALIGAGVVVAVVGVVVWTGQGKNAGTAAKAAAA